MRHVIKKIQLFHYSVESNISFVFAIVENKNVSEMLLGRIIVRTFEATWLIKQSKAVVFSKKTKKKNVLLVTPCDCSVQIV